MAFVEQALMSGEYGEYIGHRIATPFGVDSKTGTYPVLKINAGNMLRNLAKALGAGSAYPRVSRKWETDNYACIKYGLEDPVADDDRADVAKYFQLEQTETKLTHRQVLLANEIRVASELFSTSNWSLSTSATAYTTTNLTSFDIAFDVDLAKLEIKNRGESTNPADLVAVMSESVFLRARQSTRLQNRIRGQASSDSTLTLDAAAVAEALGVREVMIGGGVYDTTLVNAASSSLSSIWSNSYVWIGNVKDGDLKAGGAIRSLFWKERGGIVTVETYREENVESDVIRVRQWVDEKIINANAGQLLVTQFS
jgi:hypothetical protein